MTILSIAQICAQRIGLPSIATLVGNTDNNAILLGAKLVEAAWDIRGSASWPELQKEFTFTLADGVASYALPVDLDYRIFETEWDRNNKWPLIGPLSPQDWQYRKSGISNVVPRKMFRVKGYADKQIFIHPTPGAGDAGSIIAMEYSSKTWLRPKTWVASTSWAGIQYCFYNGNIYDRGGTGAASTGTTPPTHTSGGVSDGSITWTYTLSPYETLVHDSDEVILGQDLIIEGTIWRFKRERGFFYEEEQAQAINGLRTAISDLNGSGVINWGANRLGGGLIGPWSIPDGNWPY